MELEKILKMLEEREFKELKEELSGMYPVDIAALLEEVDKRQIVLIFRLLAKEEAAETFTYMDSDTREFLINALTDSELEEVMDEMYLDDTVDVLEELPANVIIANHKSAIGAAKQINEMEAMRLQNAFADGIRGLCVYGDKVLRDDASAALYYEVGTSADIDPINVKITNDTANPVNTKEVAAG